MKFELLPYFFTVGHKIQPIGTIIMNTEYIFLIELGDIMFIRKSLLGTYSKPTYFEALCIRYKMH